MYKISSIICVPTAEEGRHRVRSSREIQKWNVDDWLCWTTQCWQVLPDECTHGQKGKGLS